MIFVINTQVFQKKKKLEIILFYSIFIILSISFFHIINNKNGNLLFIPLIFVFSHIDLEKKTKTKQKQN